MIDSIFLELGAIVLVALVVSGVMSFLKQPLIIGYIISGILLGPYFLNITKSTDAIATFSQMGVIFLLFLVGIGLNPKVIKDVGKVSLITGIGQVVFTSIGGTLIALALGFDLVTSIYVAIALTFSSTIIIMKIISDKDDQDSVYGRIAIGFLIVQDLVVMLLLLITASFAESGLSLGALGLLVIFKIILIGLSLALIGHYILPKLMSFAAKSQEYLLLVSVAWCLLVALIFHQLDFSMEFGALLAGVILSNSPYKFEVVSKLKPLRDFFIFMFFIYLGSHLIFSDISQFIVPIIIFSLFILIGNPIIVMTLMGFLGYTKKTSFLAGLTVAQISEFSLIYIAMGISVGHISQEVLPLVTIVGLITIAGSTYLMTHSGKIYYRISKYLKIFEKRGKKVDDLKFHEGSEFDVILFGYNRMGRNIEKALKKLKTKYLIVDFNPEVIRGLSDQKVESRYGDVSDMELLDELNLCKAQMVVSTVKDFDTNALMIKKVRERNKNIIILTVSNQEDEALELYKRGASYVILPHHLGGYHASLIIKDFGFNQKKFISEMEKQIKRMTFLYDGS
ncbi:MAG: cation:proton antiporter [Patescibacteria group bacterium]|nr:cation:proton antiporter [Patescibacteria group bacterium]